MTSINRERDSGEDMDEKEGEEEDGEDEEDAGEEMGEEETAEDRRWKALRDGARQELAVCRELFGDLQALVAAGAPALAVSSALSGEAKAGPDGGHRSAAAKEAHGGNGDSAPQQQATFPLLEMRATDQTQWVASAADIHAALGALQAAAARLQPATTATGGDGELAPKERDSIAIPK